jgi:predicted homoserine dehydrogenase-like protein
MIRNTPATESAPIRVALTGAYGGYGRTLLSQLRQVPDMTPAVLIDPNVDGVLTLLRELGYAEDTIARCSTDAETAAASAAGQTAVVASMDAIDWASFDVLVEASGQVSAGYAYARTAIETGRHVVMVSKEVESLAGVSLAAAARAADVAYLPGDGDQPANLLRLVAWVRRVGLEIVAVGKSSEYDLVFDPNAGTVTQVDTVVAAPELAGLLELGTDVRSTLALRADAVSALKRSAAADLCEMAVVSNYTGFTPDTEKLHYPVARATELADIYSLAADGGILDHEGSVDVFSMLRLPGEASFAGGVFVVVRTTDAETWEILRSKGHVVSRDGRYACIYWPYHAMGVETPLTIADAMAGTVHPEPRQHSVLVGRAERDLPEGTLFTVKGHHHEIDAIAPTLLAAELVPAAVAPFYLLGGARLVRSIRAGELIGFDDLSGVDAATADAFRAGRALDLSTRTAGEVIR